MAIILDGRKVAATFASEVKEEVERLKNSGITPKLSVILIGDDPASVLYARSKEKACNNVGMAFELYVLPPFAGEEKVIELVEELNGDRNVHGILIEYPLPQNMNKQRIFETVLPVKDVDGVHPINRGHILSNTGALMPATPQSCIELLRAYGVEIRGKHAVLVGRGETVGKPLIFMLLNHDATVTVCHTKTVDLPHYTRQADILISAAGRPRLIKKDMVKPGAVVVDAGINEAEGGGICGDVDFEGVKEVAGAISPVPGGVGSLTTVIIQKNVLRAARLQTNAG